MPSHADHTVAVEHSIDSAIAYGKNKADALDVDELMIIGGANIYNATLHWVDRVYRTLVHMEPEGDAFFQPLDTDKWRLLSSEEHSGDITYTYQIFDRISVFNLIL